MINVLIIEDEREIASYLSSLLKQIDPEIFIQAHLDTVKKAITWLSQYKSDLIFLDVNLGDELAFKIFEGVKVDTPVIFTTAYDKYAMQAFQVNSIDYLLKPVQPEELIRSLQKFKNLQIPTSLNLKNLLQNFAKPAKEYQKRFMAISGERIKSIPVEEIAYFEGHQKYVFLMTHQKEQFIVDFTLEKLEELLDPEKFFRVNRQFIVSFPAIKNMFAYSRGRIKLELTPACKEEIIVSIDRAGDFKNWLNQ
jgi:DNA-binding LytR/AlgR family response regulator